MENKEEIFRAWLKKYVKEDKKVTGRQLSKRLNVTPPTVTAWHSGRKNYKGEKYFPHIPFDVQKKIIEMVGIPEDQILTEGRKILSIKNTDREDDKCDTCSENVFKLNDPLEAEHLSIIRKFKNKHMACTLNRYLVELEDLDDGEFAGVVSDVKRKIETLRNSKKRAANGED